MTTLQRHHLYSCIHNTIKITYAQQLECKKGLITFMAYISLYIYVYILYIIYIYVYIQIYICIYIQFKTNLQVIIYIIYINELLDFFKKQTLFYKLLETL